MKTGFSQMINGYITEADFDRVYERAYHSRTPDTHMLVQTVQYHSFIIFYKIDLIIWINSGYIFGSDLNCRLKK